jgi:hypothetical protein
MIEIEGTTITLSIGLLGALLMAALIIESAVFYAKRAFLTHSLLLYFKLCRQAKKQAPPGWKYEATFFDFFSIDGRGQKGYTAYVTMRSIANGLHQRPVMTFAIDIDWKGKTDLGAIKKELESENRKCNAPALSQIIREDRLKELGI